MKSITISWILILSAIFGSINSLNAQDMNNSLTLKQQKIAAIASHTAIGDLDQLKTELNAGLDAGLSINQIREVLVQMYAYSGFPRSLQGLNTFMAVLEDRQARGIQDEKGDEASPITDTRDKYTRGREILEELTGVSQKQVSGANAFAPAIDVFLKEHLFADIFERDVLTYAERELATISALAAMNGVEPMLQSHMNMGKNVGISPQQINEIVELTGRNDSNGIFPQGEPASPDYFTGTVNVQGLVNPDEIEGLYSVGSVTFQPGARTNWHTHPAGQILLVTDGRGWYQERGKEAQPLIKGSVIAIPKDIEHWHGAAADSKLVHIAISNMSEGTNVTWMTPVNNDEYGTVNK